MTEAEKKSGVTTGRGRSVREILDAMAAGERLAPEEQAVLDSLKHVKGRVAIRDTASGRSEGESSGRREAPSLDQALRRIVREEIDASLDERGFPRREPRG